MPVVTVTAPALESGETELATLRRLCAVIADALGLQPHDVYAARVVPELAVLGEEQIRPWPVVVLHGGMREPEAMAAAQAAAERVAADAWRTAPGAVWCQWVVRQ